MNTSKNKKVAQALIKGVVLLIVTFALISSAKAEIIIQGHSISV